MCLGLMADFRNPPDGSRAARDVYHEIIDHLVWSEFLGFGDAHFLETPLHLR